MLVRVGPGGPRFTTAFILNFQLPAVPVCIECDDFDHFRNDPEPGASFDLNYDVQRFSDVCLDRSEPNAKIGGMSGAPVLRVGMLNYPLVGVLSNSLKMGGEFEIVQFAPLRGMVI